MSQQDAPAPAAPVYGTVNLHFEENITDLVEYIDPGSFLPVGKQMLDPDVDVRWNFQAKIYQRHSKPGLGRKFDKEYLQNMRDEIDDAFTRLQSRYNDLVITLSNRYVDERAEGRSVSVSRGRSASRSRKRKRNAEADAESESDEMVVEEANKDESESKVVLKLLEDIDELRIKLQSVTQELEETKQKHNQERIYGRLATTRGILESYLDRLFFSPHCSKGYSYWRL